MKLPKPETQILAARCCAKTVKVFILKKLVKSIFFPLIFPFWEAFFKTASIYRRLLFRHLFLPIDCFLNTRARLSIALTYLKLYFSAMEQSDKTAESFS